MSHCSEQNYQNIHLLTCIPQSHLEAKAAQTFSIFCASGHHEGKPFEHFGYHHIFKLHTLLATCEIKIPTTFQSIIYNDFLELTPLFKATEEGGLPVTKAQIDYCPSKYDRAKLDAQTEEMIDQVWEQKKQACPRIYNASKFRLSGLEGTLEASLFKVMSVHDL